MAKAKLSAAFALTAKCKEGRRKIDYYDDGTSCIGLVLEVRSSGGKTWHLRFENAHGKQCQVKLAKWEDATFDQVRRKARQLRSEVTLGGDPAAAKAAIKAIPLYSELSVMHLADAKLHQRSYDTTEMYVRRHIIPRWGKVRLKDIDGRAVAHWLATKRDEGLAPATVIKIKAIFGRSFELGIRWGVAGCDKNPVRGIQSKPLNNARERFLTAEEASRLRMAVAKSKNQQLKFIVDWLLYTGCRLRECLDARWEHINVEAQNWHVPLAKNGHARNNPMSSAALRVLASVPRFEGCPWVFPNPETQEPYVSIKHAWQTARDEAGLPGLRLHDCRHAFASFAVNSGVDLFTVGRLLGHRNVQSTQRYSHLANDTLLAAVEAGAAKQAQPA